MKNEKAHTLTVASLPTWIQSGDVLEMHGKGKYKVTSVASGTTMEIRDLRWYERLWIWLRIGRLKWRVVYMWWGLRSRLDSLLDRLR